MRHPVLHVFLLFSLSTVITASAQRDTAVADPGYDTTYIKSFRNDFVVTALSATTGNSIIVTDNQGRDIEFGTNVPTSFGVGLDYKWITLEYTSSFGRTGPEAKGCTEMQNIGVGLTGRKFWFRNFYQSTQGYYLKNPQYFDNSFDPKINPYPHRDDVRSSVYYATLNYGFNHRRFSNMAAIWQLERQQKSAGTFTAGMTFSMGDYHADSALIPEKSEDYFGREQAIIDLRFRMYGINAGYLHTFSFTKSKKMFLSLTFIPGICYQTAEANNEEAINTIRKKGIGFHSEARVVTGYNGDRLYASITTIAYTISSSFSEMNPFSQGYGFGRIAVGYKFHLPETKNPFLKRIGL
ncbi:MAG: DUF4421 family protein [Bacteroidota bacterium]